MHVCHFWMIQINKQNETADKDYKNKHKMQFLNEGF